MQAVCLHSLLHVANCMIRESKCGWLLFTVLTSAASLAGMLAFTTVSTGLRSMPNSQALGTECTVVLVINCDLTQNPDGAVSEAMFQDAELIGLGKQPPARQITEQPPEERTINVRSLHLGQISA